MKNKEERDARIKKLEKQIIKKTKEIARLASQPDPPGSGG